jgi:hypothetical protein
MTCHICRMPAEKRDMGGWWAVDCVRCGIWTVLGSYQQGTLLQYLNGKLGRWEDLQSRHRRSRLSYLISKQQTSTGTVVTIPLDQLETWRLEDPLPTPLEQMDELVLVIGSHQSSPGEWAKISLHRASALIGCSVSPSALQGIIWLLKQEKAIEYFERAQSEEGHQRAFRLSFSGWERYALLRRAQVETRTAFMAMQFGDTELNHVVDTCFRPAVDQAGITLRVLTDGQPAGSIDDQLRVALRTSRFVIADLSHGNRGAYWEAGFAEGLGRPVIYTCKEELWDDPETRPHFDTNHLLTISWNVAALEIARERLTATIRATLPGEAKMDG